MITKPTKRFKELELSKVKIALFPVDQVSDLHFSSVLLVSPLLDGHFFKVIWGVDMVFQSLLGLLEVFFAQRTAKHFLELLRL